MDLFGLGSAVGSIGSSIVGGLFSSRNTDKTNQANKDINKDTNAINLQIAQENLGFQRENLDYQKALQQQLFDREDTAYQRTVNDMRSAGLSPLAMQGTNGAGEAVSTSPLNNDFQAQGYTAIKDDYDWGSSLNNAINTALSGAQAKYQMQSMQADIDSKNLDNRLKALTFMDNVMKSGIDLKNMQLDLSRSMSEHQYEKTFGLNRSMQPVERNASLLFNLLGMSPFSKSVGDGLDSHNVYNNISSKDFKIFLQNARDNLSLFNPSDVLSSVGSAVNSATDKVVEKAMNGAGFEKSKDGDFSKWKFDEDTRKKMESAIKNSWFNKVFRWY